jgi:hypothetical protein
MMVQRGRINVWALLLAALLLCSGTTPIFADETDFGKTDDGGTGIIGPSVQTGTGDDVGNNNDPNGTTSVEMPPGSGDQGGGSGDQGGGSGDQGGMDTNVTGGVTVALPIHQPGPPVQIPRR